MLMKQLKEVSPKVLAVVGTWASAAILALVLYATTGLSFWAATGLAVFGFLVNGLLLMFRGSGRSDRP